MLKEINLGLESTTSSNHEHYEKAEPVYATLSETGDEVGEMQVEMTNNVAKKGVHFMKTSILTPTVIQSSRVLRYKLRLTKCSVQENICIHFN